jgi:hypothetical protein
MKPAEKVVELPKDITTSMKARLQEDARIRDIIKEELHRFQRGEIVFVDMAKVNEKRMAEAKNWWDIAAERIFVESWGEKPIKAIADIIYDELNKVKP